MTPARIDSTRRARLILPLAALLAATLLAGCFSVADRPGADDGRRNQALMFPPPPDEPRFVYERTIHGSADVIREDATST